MQVYKLSQLYCRYVQEQAAEAAGEHLVSKDSFDKIKAAYPDKLYTPNFFVRIALVLLTAVAILFSAALFSLFFLSDNGVVAGLVFMAVVCYAALEWFIRKKAFYNAGVDNTLMLAILLFVTIAFFVADLSIDIRLVAAVSILLCGWMCIRFADAFMAVLSYVFLYVFLFSNLVEMGSTVQMLSPMLMMAFSALVYFAFQRLRKPQGFALYKSCYNAITLCALLSFYFSGNYFVVNSLSMEMFGSSLAASALMAGLFWSFTVSIPVLYVIAGVIRKDRQLIRTGLALIAVAIFIVRYYFAVLPLEVTMLIIGTLLIGISYFFIRYLHNPKHGFVFKPKVAHAIPIEHVESLLTTESFGATAPVETGFQFGGGSGGGGGATGSF